MTDDSTFDIGKSRRSFLKEGAIATGGLALGLSAGGAAAQEDNETGNDTGTDDTTTGGENDGHLYVSAYYPNSKFAIVSDSLDWSPNADAISDDASAHMIRYLNTGEVVPLFVSGDADIPSYDDQSGFVPSEDGGTTGDTGMNETGDNESDGGLLGGNDTAENDTGANDTNDSGGLFGGDDNESAENDTTGGASQGTETRPAVYEFGGDASLEGDELVSVTFSESDADNLLDEEDWWQDAGGTDTTEDDGGLFGGDDNETAENDTGMNESDNESDGGLFGGDENDTTENDTGLDDTNDTNDTNDTGGGLFGGDNETNDTGTNDTNDTNDTGGGLFGGGGNDTNDTNDTNDSGGGIF